MARIAAGDQRAFEQLVKGHAPRLQRLIGRLTGWHTDTDDLLQETLIAVWEKANKYDEQGSLHAWLTRIAVNRVKNRYRGLERLRRNLEILASQLFSQTTQPRPAATDEEDSLLAAALRQLSHSDRNLLVLYYLEELPAEQVAELENTTVDSLYVRLHRARKRLKDRVEQLGSNHE